ncbi:cytochrome bd-I oxidase subunit CydX [Faucicola mancuniensis]|uniref:cytochrome bd-I oxidase subunit CydX n=1 Tax=Faucicola mancuniensis TaxID=1309795 RepID=UPI0039779852
MWYFAWVLGLGFAVLLAILNALWLENADARNEAFNLKQQDNPSNDGTVTQGNPIEDIHKKT